MSGSGIERGEGCEMGFLVVITIVLGHQWALLLNESGRATKNV